MRRLRIRGRTGDTEIFLGYPYTEIERLFPLERPVIITDSLVHRTYGKGFPRADIIRIPAGEKSKTLKTVERLYRRFLSLGVDRSSTIVGVGGGTVCDVTGFASSTYMRGIPFGFIPTTLLAQGDASIGGKNGINILGYKNIAGTITQPVFVLCDLGFLGTLPIRELRSGFAEIIKHGAIADERLFTLLEKKKANALSLDGKCVEEILYRSISVKASIIQRDEMDTGERRKLNFGHTVGHALESMSGLPHGECVSLGMSIAARISVMMGVLSREDEKRLTALLEEYGLPTRMSMIPARVIHAIEKDKKRSSGMIHLVLLRKIGEAYIEDIPLTLLRRLIRQVLKAG